MLWQEPEHPFPPGEAEVVKEIAPGQPTRGIFFPGRRMKRVFQVWNVAGVETLAQQEGRVDAMAEEDGLQA